MDFNQVRYFLALAETLNFSKAAEKCNVSQSALTQAIKRIELELEGEVIARQGKSTELTVLGRSLYEPFAQLERTRKLVKATAKAVASGERAEINIGVMCTIGPSAFTEMLNNFRCNNPMVSVVIHDIAQDQISKLLLTGVLDGVFCTYHDSNNEKLNFKSLFEEELVVACAKNHPLEAYDEVELREVATYPYVDRLHCEFREQFLKFFDDENLALNVIFRSQREDWIYCMIRDGIGISVMPRTMLFKSEVSVRRIINPGLSRKIEFITAKQEGMSPVLNSFFDEVNGYDWKRVEKSKG